MSLDMNEDAEEFDLAVHYSTISSWLCSETGRDADAKLWLPKSRCWKDDKVKRWIDEPGRGRYPVHTFRVPVWLAREKRML